MLNVNVESVVAIIALIVSIFTYTVYKKQTKISQGENEPKIIFTGMSKDNEKANKVFSFENLGKPVIDLRVYITDEIFLSRDISEGNCSDVALLPIGLNLRVNGRYRESFQKSNGQNQCVCIEEDSNENILSFEAELMDRLNCSTLIWKRVLISYVDFEGIDRKKEYMLMQQDLYREDSDSYKIFDFGRENILNYDTRLQNKNIIIDLAKKELDSLY